MLLVRGILQVLLTATSADQERNVFMLLLVIVFILFALSIKNFYKQMSDGVLESPTSLNLIILSSGTLYKWESTVTISRLILLEVSIEITFYLFCIIVVLSVTKPCCSAGWKYKWNHGYDTIDGDSTQPDNDFIHEQIKDAMCNVFK